MYKNSPFKEEFNEYTGSCLGYAIQELGVKEVITLGEYAGAWAGAILEGLGVSHKKWKHLE